MPRHVLIYPSTLNLHFRLRVVGPPVSVRLPGVRSITIYFRMGRISDLETVIVRALSDGKWHDLCAIDYGSTLDFLASSLAIGNLARDDIIEIRGNSGRLKK